MNEKPFDNTAMKEIKWLIWNFAKNEGGDGYLFLANFVGTYRDGISPTKYFQSISTKALSELRKCVYPEYQKEFEAALLELEMSYL